MVQSAISYAILSIAILAFPAHIMNAAADENHGPSQLLVPTSEGNRWGLIDQTGKLLVPPTYRNIWGFNKTPNGNSIAVVMGKHYEYGFVDATGREIHPPTLEDAFRFQDGFANFQRDGKWGFLNSDGEPVISPQYEETGEFSCGLAPVMNNEDQWSYIDATGNAVIPGPFVAAKPFGKNGVAAVATSAGEKRVGAH